MRFLGLALTCLASTIWWPGNARADQCEPARVSEIAAGVFVRLGEHGVVFRDKNTANIGFIVGKQCVAVIDTGGSEEEGLALRCAIGQVTTVPVCHVINSHVHPDHTLGNVAFKGLGVDFIGHANLPRAMGTLGAIYLERASASAGRSLGTDYLVVPQRTVADVLSLDLGGRVIELRSHPSAHTDNDLSVYDSMTQTLWLADLLFVEHVPVIDASVLGWIGELEALMEKPAACVVPGHGPVQTEWPAGGENLLRYLTVLRDETRAWIADGGGLRGAQETLGRSESDKWLLFDEYHQRNIARVFSELEWEE